MSLGGSAKWENMKRSFDVFVNTQYAASFAPPTAGIKYSGTVNVLDTANLKEWIEPFVVGPAQPNTGYGRFKDGARTDWLEKQIPIFQVNIFSRPRSQTVAHRLAMLRDIVLAPLFPGKTIPMKDYASGFNTDLGAVPLRRISMDQEIRTSLEQQDLEQWTVSVDGDWVAHVDLS